MRKYWHLLTIVILLTAALNFIKVPYYITKPGSAAVLKPLVHVENGDDDEGELMLVTVRMGEASVAAYLLSYVLPYHERFKNEAILQDGQSDEEYEKSQLFAMANSKQAAISVAYKRANKPVVTKVRGLYVMNTYPGMAASRVLKTGDLLVAVDGRKFKNEAEFINYVTTKQAGDVVKVTYKRGKAVKTTSFTLKRFTPKSDRVGIGVSLFADRQMTTVPAVDIDSERIGGPSAGLMFTLEIYNQLVPADITHGKKIAGTGTMSEDGIVGPIGGIEQKVVAADREGADVFFAPNEAGAKDSNYRAAVATAKELGTKMKIVPVDTVDDALSYLKRLQ